MGCAFQNQPGCQGCGPPPECGSIFWAVVDCFQTPLNGATITLKKGGVTIGTGTTGEDGGITRISVTNGGSGYTSAPTVTITGGGGSGATATATIGGFPSQVTGISVTNRGTGYTGNPTVTLSGGGGSGATAVGYYGGGLSLPISVGGSDYSYVIEKSGYNTITSPTFQATCSTNSIFPTMTSPNGKVCIKTQGCQFGLSAFDDPVSGVTVHLSQSGAVVASGVTGSDGTACFLVAPGTYDVTADPINRFIFDSTTTSATGCQTSEPILTGSGATGYHCFGNSNPAFGLCKIPVADTLTLTDSVFGAATLFWSDTGANGAGWYGSLAITVNCVGAGCSGNSTLNYYLSPDAKLTALTAIHSPSQCMDNTGTSPVTPHAAISCPPSFMVTFRVGSFGALPWCDVADITITE